MAYILHRRLFENAFEISIKETSFSSTVNDLAETKLKNKRHLYGELAGKTKLAKEIAKRQEKIYTSTDKVRNVVSLAARNSMDEYTDEEINIIDDLELIPCNLMSY